MPTPDRQRAERRDARANRERLLDTAEAYFAEAGIDASLHELVARAGTGIGTLYRHFPTHADLIRALYDRLVARLDVVHERAEAAPSGWDALVCYIDGALELFGESPAASAIMQRQGRNDPGYRPGVRWEEPMERFVALAQAEGTLRADLRGTDIAVIPYLLSGVLRFPEPVRSMVLARQRSIMLDGLRAAPGRTVTAPSVSADEFHGAAHDQHYVLEPRED